MREIKFKIIYGIEGKQETYFSKVFTFDEIGNGDHFDVLSDNPLYDDYSILKVLRYTGIGAIFEHDMVQDHNGTGFIEYVDKYAAFRVNYKNGYCKWFYHYLESEYKSIELLEGKT